MPTHLQADSHRRLIRRIAASTHTLYAVTEEIEEVDSMARDEIFAHNGVEYVSAEQRADLVIAVENLIDITMYLTERTRALAWKHTEVPASDNSDDD